MTPEEQLSKLVELATNFSHVVKSIDDIKRQIAEQPTKADLREFVTSKEIDGLRDQVRALQSQIDELKRGSPARIWDVAIKGASGVGIMWGFVALVRDYFQNGWHK